MISTSDIRTRQQQLPPKLQYTKELSSCEQAARGLGDGVQHLRRAAINSKRLVLYITGQSTTLEWKAGPSQQRRDRRLAMDPPMPATHGDFLNVAHQEHQELRRLKEQKLAKQQKLTNAYNAMHQQLEHAKEQADNQQVQQHKRLIKGALKELTDDGTITPDQAKVLRARELTSTEVVLHGKYSALECPDLGCAGKAEHTELLTTVENRIAKRYQRSPLAPANNPRSIDTDQADEVAKAKRRKLCVNKAMDALQEEFGLRFDERVQILRFESEFRSPQERLTFWDDRYPNDGKMAVLWNNRVHEALFKANVFDHPNF